MSFAVDPADLAPYGLTRDNRAGPSYLPLLPSSQINPLFRYENFTHQIPYERLYPKHAKRANERPHWHDPITRETHARLTPAFALATKFLQHSAWFAYAVRNAPTDTYLVDGKRQQAFTLPGQPFTFAQRQTISQQLATIASGQLRFITGYTAEQLQASAESAMLKTTWTPVPRFWYESPALRRMNPGDPGVRFIISLPSEAFHLLESPAWPNLSESARMRFLFHLALTLVHETMHVLYMARHADADQGLMRQSPHREPRFCADGPLSVGAELGNAWEMFFFGGVLEIPFDGPFLANESDSGQPSGFSYDHDVDGQVRYRFPTLTQQWRDLDVEQAETETEYLSPWNCVAKHVIVSLSVEQFFDPGRWAHFEWIIDLIPPGFRIPGWEALAGLGAGDGMAVESPFQLRFAPFRYQQTILGDRGEGVDDRSEGPEGRGEIESQYDKMLEMCYEGHFRRLPGDEGQDGYESTKSGTTSEESSENDEKDSNTGMGGT